MADLDAVNLGLDEAEANMTAGLPDIEDTFDTRSEASAANESARSTSSASSSDSDPSISSVSDASVSPKTRRPHLNRERTQSQSKASASSAQSGHSAGASATTNTNDKSNSTHNASKSSVSATKRAHSPSMPPVKKTLLSLPTSLLASAHKNDAKLMTPPPAPSPLTPHKTNGPSESRPKQFVSNPAVAVQSAATSSSAAAMSAGGSTAADKEKSDKEKSFGAYDYRTKLNYFFRETRFFLIKSNNAENVVLSKERGVWSTLPQNEANLNQAYRESRNVILIFSVKESGRFAGFARMNGESRRDVPAVSWVLPPGLSAKVLGGVIKVDWVCKRELPFIGTSHLYNPWNEGKPVKIGRDGQEIEAKIGAELCRLFPEDQHVDLLPILKRSKETARLLREQGVRMPFKGPAALLGMGGIGSRHQPSAAGADRLGGGLLPMRGRQMVDSSGKKKLFLTSRSKMNSGVLSASGPGAPYKRNGTPPYGGGGGSGGGSRDHYRGAGGSSMGGGGGNGPPHTNWDRYSSTAAAEAYVADYMRTMQHQLPPMPYAPPPGKRAPITPLHWHLIVTFHFDVRRLRGADAVAVRWTALVGRTAALLRCPIDGRCGRWRRGLRDGRQWWWVQR